MPSVIHVITSGVDWPAVGAAIATVIAAVVGIAGTAMQAQRGRITASEDLKESLDAATRNLKLSISAENDRARRDEKRQAYIDFQARMNQFIATAGRLDSYDPRTAQTGRASLVHALADSVAAMNNALSSLTLAAPETLRRQADAAVQAFFGYAGQVELGVQTAADLEEFIRLRDGLYEAMREDLQETAPAEP